MTGRIFITGDKHGTFGPFFGLAERNQLQEEDILLITGDAGYVWDQNYPTQIQTLEQLFPGAVAFVDGNHENHALLSSLPEEMWNGGRVHRVGERVYHLMRGELYDLGGHTVFTFGGARSVDVDRREDGFSWWKRRGWRCFWAGPTAWDAARRPCSGWPSGWCWRWRRCRSGAAHPCRRRCCRCA